MLLWGAAANSPEMTRAVADVRANVQATGEITNLRPDVVAKDGRHVIVQFTLKESDDPLPAIQRAVSDAERANPSVQMGGLAALRPTRGSTTPWAATSSVPR